MLPLVFGLISAAVFGIASVSVYGFEGLMEYGYIFLGLIMLGLVISFLDETNQCLACRVKDKLLSKDLFGSLCAERHCFG